MIFTGGSQQSDQWGWVLWCSGSCAGQTGQDGGAGLMDSHGWIWLINIFSSHFLNGFSFTHIWFLSPSQIKAGYLDWRPFLLQTPTPPLVRTDLPARWSPPFHLLFNISFVHHTCYCLWLYAFPSVLSLNKQYYLFLILGNFNFRTKKNKDSILHCFFFFH